MKTLIQYVFFQRDENKTAKLLRSTSSHKHISDIMEHKHRFFEYTYEPMFKVVPRQGFMPIEMCPLLGT